MSENYFYSSLSGQEIEDTLLGSVRGDVAQTRSNLWKAQARQNIGAGAEATGFQILGYYDTLQDLIDSLQVLPQPGDAYGIGVAPPYHIYVYDGTTDTWLDNGTLNVDVIIDDADVSEVKTWSSDKISTELSGKQATLTFDNVPTENSNNPVKSGGVYDAIEEAKALRFTGVIISTGTNTTIATISNAAITADHELVSCVFANPSAISSDVTWTPANGSLTLTGTCTAATTADIVLVKGANNGASGTIQKNMVLLWTNSSLTSNFAAQTIPLDLTPYGGIAVDFVEGTTETTNGIRVFADRTLKARVVFLYNRRYFRFFSMTDTGVVFEGGKDAAYNSTLTDDNSVSIPFRIYGIRDYQ